LYCVDCSSRSMMTLFVAKYSSGVNFLWFTQITKIFNVKFPDT